MKIGIAAENRPMEKRVIIRPDEIRGIALSHEVVIENGAGEGINIPDSDYIKAGAKIGSKEEVYSCELVVRIKEPTEEELNLTKPGSIFMSMMHLRCSQELKRSFAKHNLTAIPLENIKDPFGRRRVEALLDSGRIGMEYGFKLWGKDPSKCHVKIMGYGNVAFGAIRCAACKHATLEILNKSHFNQMEKHLPGTDILVDAVNRPFRPEVEKEPPFVTREMLKLLKKGSVIVDLVSNPVNHAPVETMHPTSIKDPYFVVDGIFHTSCWGWPGFEPRAISKRYSIQLTPILKEIADSGLQRLPEYLKSVAVFPSA